MASNPLPPQPLKYTHPFWKTQLNSLHTIYSDAYNDFATYERISPARIANIENDFKDGYINPHPKVPYRKADLRSKQHRDEMATHIKGWAADIGLVIIMENWLFIELPRDSPLIPKVQKLLSYWYGAASMKAIDRFMSRTQPHLQEDLPFPTDGSEILAEDRNGPGMREKQMLDAEWQFRRLFVRALHFPGLIGWNTATGARQAGINVERLEYWHLLYKTSRCLLEWEWKLHKGPDKRFPYNEQDPRYNDVKYLKNSRSKMQNALKAMLAVAKTTKCGPQADHEAYFEELLARTGTPETPKDIFEYNTKKQQMALGQEMQNVMDAELEESPYARLLFEILDAQDTFERILAGSHIDDKLVDKQISLFDDEEVVRGPNDPDIIERFTPLYGPPLEAILRDISFVNRQRRNWRLFKDWNLGHRPWHRMYLLYGHDADEDLWAMDSIKIFTLRQLFRSPRNPIDEDAHPSSYRRVHDNLFDIRPTTTASPLLKAEPYCKICGLGFAPVGRPLTQRATTEPNSRYNPFTPLAHVLTRLLCGHLVHTTCIFDCWDQPGEQTHSCPICLKAAYLNWEIASVYPLDYVHVLSPGRPVRNTFAHNVIADNRATDMMVSKQYEPLTNKKLRKEYWDTPKERGFQHFDYSLNDRRGQEQATQVGSPSDLDQRAKAYWIKENMDLAFLQHNPLQWSTQWFDVGDRATTQVSQLVDVNTGQRQTQATLPTFWINNFGVDLAPPVAPQTTSGGFLIPPGATRLNQYIESEPPGPTGNALTLGTAIGREWMKRKYQPDPTLPDYEPDVYDIEKIRILKPSKPPPSVEAAEMRRRKRQRTDLLARINTGFGSLGSLT